MRWLTLALVFFLAANAHAASIQARLIRASNESIETDAQLKDLTPTLEKKFGYKHYQQLGSQKASLGNDTSRRLDLGEGFVVFVRERATDKKTHDLEVEWTSGRASLLKTTLKIAEKSSVFIKGPGVGNDWIVLALTVLE
jgi:hypothetical protein